MSLKEILEPIFAHNQSIYDNTPRNEKIDFSKTKISWGSSVIPKELHIDLNKEYKTRNGKKVHLYQIVMTNSANNEVTYPVKGHYILERPNKKDKTINCIWSLDGRENVTKIESDLDLIAV